MSLGDSSPSNDEISYPAPSPRVSAIRLDAPGKIRPTGFVVQATTFEIEGAALFSWLTSAYNLPTLRRR
jgi:hypothetical protein